MQNFCGPRIPTSPCARERVGSCLFPPLCRILGFYRLYIGIMEKKMETTDYEGGPRKGIPCGLCSSEHQHVRWCPQICCKGPKSKQTSFAHNCCSCFGNPPLSSEFIKKFCVEIVWNSDTTNGAATSYTTLETVRPP